MTIRTQEHQALARTARLAVVLNLGYFGIEVAVALAIGSVSLFADSVDFLEDASIGILLVVGLAWSARARARLGMILAVVILVPGLATLVMAWLRFADCTPPQPLAIGLTGLGALAVNATCAFLLARRARGGRQPRQGGVSLGTQRRAGKPRDHRRGAGDGGDALALARPRRRARHRRAERRRGVGRCGRPHGRRA